MTPHVKSAAGPHGRLTQVLVAIGALAALLTVPESARAQSWESTDRLAPLISWYSASREDHFTTANQTIGQQGLGPPDGSE